MVIMLPGAAVNHANFANIIHDISLLHSLGVRLVLVHGARQQIDRRLGDKSIDSQFHRGMRITDQGSLQCILEAVGSVRLKIEAALSTGLPNSPMHNAHIKVRSGNIVTAMPSGIIDGIDLQYTGQVRKIDVDALQEMIHNNAIALVSPVGYSLTGELFNLTYTDVATQIAIDLKADKLIALTKAHGIVDEKGVMQRQLTLLQCEKLLLKKETTDSHFSLKACYKACDQGVTRAQIVSYTEDGAIIKELFSRDGFGTMVHRDSYETIRRARFDDVGGIIELLTPLEEMGILVRRSRERLEQEIEHFTVMEKDGMIVSCAALYPFKQKNTGELACVATHPDYKNQGKAAKLLMHIEKQAHKLSIKQLFVLTTQTAHWFLEQGFKPTNIQTLPEEKQAPYNYHRNSKVFVKALD